MKNINPSFLLLFLMLSSCFVGQILGKDMIREGDALKKLLKAKLDGSSKIDTSPFKIGKVGPSKITLDTGASNIYQNANLFGETGYSKENDRIEKLPGQPEVNFLQYGGYVTVDESAGRAFYYYFVEAEHSKESLPLLLWLNGGPGCSSVGYGAMEELGPFRVRSDGKTLYENKCSWNRAANVLFLESPAGVGFSYSNTSSDYAKVGDKRTAADNYVFLLNWLDRFPEYKDRDFYIGGESYAGHYVPQLAVTILYHKKKEGITTINLKGIIMGNAVINDETDFRGMYDFYASHALTSQETLKQIHKNCNFSANAAVTMKCGLATFKADKDCDYVNNFNIYGSTCFNKTTTAKPKKTSFVKVDPCTDYYVSAYLNRPDVQEAMHANITKIKNKWEACSNKVVASWTDSPSTIVPLLRKLMRHGFRVWVYSGDTDGRLPVTSTQYSIMSMNLPIENEWYPWEVLREAGGYAQVYKGDLTFATVRGAGHEVPIHQPRRAFTLIMHFLNGTHLPKLEESAA